ncbi:Rne/Rng family ribonuclease [Verrucomicrobiota bacterium]
MFGFGKKDKTKREIIVNCESLETRVAVLEDGKLEEFQTENPTEGRVVGSIFKGRIQNLEHELQAAFVDIGMKKNAFLHYWDMVPDDEQRLDMEEGSQRRRPSRKSKITNEQVEKRFPQGSEIVVQVVKGPIGTKGPRVTASLSLPGRYLVMVPGSKLKGVSRKIGDASERNRLRKLLDRLPVPEDTGVIVRTAGSGARKRGFTRDLNWLGGAWEEVERSTREDQAPCCVYREPDLVERVVRDWLTEDVDRVVVDDTEKHDRLREVAGRISRKSRSYIHLYKGDLPIFDHYEVEAQVEESFRRRVALKSGGYVVFDETEAMIAVDVNTARHKGKGGSQEQAILEVNTEAVEEVARQLRLRNVGGLVVVDLIDMRGRKHQNSVYRSMKSALSRDRARTNVLTISELGLLEMTRQRTEESVFSSMYAECPYCRGLGRIKTPLRMSVDIQRQVGAIMRRNRKAPTTMELQVIVHPTVLDRLRKEDEEFLLELESKFEGHLSFRSDPTKHIEFFEIIDKSEGTTLYSSADR